MARIKVCPKCHKVNPSSHSLCECGENLFDVKAISEELYKKQLAEEALINQAKTEKAENTANIENTNDAKISAVSNEEKLADISADSSANKSQADSRAVPLEHNGNNGANGNDDNVRLIKICPKCGLENRGLAKICKSCGTNIKLVKGEYKKITPVQMASTAPVHTLAQHNNYSNINAKSYIGRLASPDNSYSFEIDTAHPIVVIGRESSMSEYLEGHMFTSRIHAEVSIVGEKLAIKDLGKANGTYVNNKRLSPNTLTLLNCGDKVSLGGKWDEDWQKSDAGCFIVCYDE